jgi:hypothetical protein
LSFFAGAFFTLVVPYGLFVAIVGPFEGEWGISILAAGVVMLASSGAAATMHFLREGCRDMDMSFLGPSVGFTVGIPVGLLLLNALGQGMD